jgi:hypothetical protein
MSTSYASTKPILITELFDGRLEQFSVREQIHEDPNEHRRCLTDGASSLWVYADSDGFVDFCDYAGSYSCHTLNSIEMAFDTRIYSEHQGEYWGFASDEEWMAWQDESAKEASDRYYGKLIKFVNGYETDCTLNNFDMARALIAKDLVAKVPELALPENRERLMNDMEDIYNRQIMQSPPPLRKSCTIQCSNCSEVCF